MISLVVKHQNRHAYTIYYIKDGVVTAGGTYTGYLPSDDIWIDGFDFATTAYTFNSKDGAKKVWEIFYPGDYDEDVITITYEGQEPQKISDSEERALFSEEILEPAGIQWKTFNKGTEVAKD